MKDVVFSKEEILKRFSTKELITELMNRDDKDFNDFIKANMLIGGILNCDFKIKKETMQTALSELEKTVD